MKTTINWRQWIINTLVAVCFFAFIMLSDETDNTMHEFIIIKIEGALLMAVAGTTAWLLARKWRREGKIKM